MNPRMQLGRSEMITGIAGILLLIGISAFPWFHVGAIRFFGTTFNANVNLTALQGPGSFFGVLALIVLIALLAEMAVSRLTPVQFPELPFPWSRVELATGVAVPVLLVIKILFHIGNFGWGFYADLVLAIVLAYGVVGASRTRDQLAGQAAADPAK